MKEGRDQAAGGANGDLCATVALGYYGSLSTSVREKPCCPNLLKECLVCSVSELLSRIIVKEIFSPHSYRLKKESL